MKGKQKWVGRQRGTVSREMAELAQEIEGYYVRELAENPKIWPDRRHVEDLIAAYARKAAAT